MELKLERDGFLIEFADGEAEVDNESVDLLARYLIN